MINGEKTEKRRERYDTDYFSADTYAEYLLRRLKNGGMLGAAVRIYKKIRKYTLFTAVIRGVAAVIALLEKSAILLLIFTAFVLVLPLALIPITVCAVICAVGYFRMNAEVREWIEGAERVTVYVTSDRFFRKKGNLRASLRERRKGNDEGTGRDEPVPLFVRCAAEESVEYTHPVIVVCSDPFLVARWAGFNLLAVKCDYFFILRRFYFTKSNVSYLVLS